MLSILTERRSYRYGAAYFPWLFIYFLFAIMLINGKGGRDAGGLLRFWPVLIPAGIVNFQLVRPTILGWVVVLLMAILFGCLQVYLAHFIFSQQDIPPNERLKDAVLYSIVTFAWISVPIGLIVAAKPAISPKPISV